MDVLKNFIVLEGVDGAGTTTQCRLLSERIEKSIFTCEPTSGTIGKMIREILSGDKVVDKKTLALLFAADRSDHIYNSNGVISQSENNLVISDRYIFSSFSYQSLDVDPDFIIQLNNSFPIPFVTFFLDTPLDECQKRLDKRNNKEIYEIKELQYKIRENYLKAIDIYSKKGFNVVKIDGNQSIEEINQQILDYLKKSNISIDKTPEIL